MTHKQKTALVILDGWGIGNGSKSDAMAGANVPFYRDLLKNYPHATLKTSGEDVGLPEGQMGNSEVGHLNIGAGRVVYQDLVRINKSIRDGDFFNEKVLLKAMDITLQNDSTLHLMGLLSDGGVHSSLEHLMALCKMADNKGLKKVNIYVFTDGRDTDPKSGINYIKQLEEYLKHTNSSARIGGVIGRYYAMDRDKRWERVKLAYDMMIHGTGIQFNSAADAVTKSYNNDITDEFIKPAIIGEPQRIKNGDTVICYNFRTDRCREITQVLTQMDFPEFDMQTKKLHYVTMTRYDEKFKNVEVVFEKDNLVNTLGEVLEKAGRTQLRMAETEKYPHVTFFFSGGRELEFKGEKRIMIPSPKVATYDLQPEMSANEVCTSVCSEMSGNNQPDFICLNFANPDMVGHTGIFSAVVRALEAVDACLSKVVQTGLENNYDFLIIADHGNADYMINDDGSPNTAHTTNPVPVILISKSYSKINNGRLADIAPTILKMMEIDKSPEMSGISLV